MYSQEPLVDPNMVAPVFASGMAEVEDVGGGNLQFTFYQWQKSTAWLDKRRERVVVARIIMPAAKVCEAAMAAMLAAEGVEGAVGRIAVNQRN